MTKPADSNSQATPVRNLLLDDEEEIRRILQEKLDIGRIKTPSQASEDEIQALLSGSPRPQAIVTGQPRPDMAYHPDFVSGSTKDMHEYHASFGEKTTYLGETPSWYTEHLAEQQAGGSEKTGYLGSVPGTVFSPSPADHAPSHYISPFERDFAAPTTRLPSATTNLPQELTTQTDASVQPVPQWDGATGLLHDNPSSAKWITVEPTVPLFGNENITKQLPDSVLASTKSLTPQPESKPTDLLSHTAQSAQHQAIPRQTKVAPQAKKGQSYNFCPHCGHALGNSLLSAGSAPEIPPPDFCPACQNALRIGGVFWILGELGRGSFGRVYQAEHITKGYSCAIKVLHPDLEHSPIMTQYRVEERPLKLQGFVTRFQREIEFLSKLSQHCNAVTQVYMQGQDPHFGPFVAMEHLRGQTLEERIPPHPTIMNPQEALQIMLALCDAMHQIHQADIWHRDLKPANLFLQQSDHSAWTLKVMDLGIAKSPQSHAPNQAKLTQGLIGTAYYCSPEQIYNQPDLDHRTDLYAMGAIFYEMLTGQPPFPGENPLHVCVAHIREEPEPLHNRRPDLHFPSGLNDVVLRALHKTPEQRFASALAFKQALLPFV